MRNSDPPAPKPVTYLYAHTMGCVRRKEVPTVLLWIRTPGQRGHNVLIIHFNKKYWETQNNNNNNNNFVDIYYWVQQSRPLNC